MFNVQVTASNQCTVRIQHTISVQCTLSSQCTVRVLYTSEQWQGIVKLLGLPLQLNVLCCTVIFDMFLKL